MLETLEMHDIQDKTRLLEEMNETREGVNLCAARIDNMVEAVNELNKKVSKLMRTPAKMQKPKSKAKPSLDLTPPKGGGGPQI